MSANPTASAPTRPLREVSLAAITLAEGLHARIVAVEPEETRRGKVISPAMLVVEVLGAQPEPGDSEDDPDDDGCVRWTPTGLARLGSLIPIGDRPVICRWRGRPVGHIGEIIDPARWRTGDSEIIVRIPVSRSE